MGCQGTIQRSVLLFIVVLCSDIASASRAPSLRREPFQPCLFIAIDGLEQQPQNTQLCMGCVFATSTLVLSTFSLSFSPLLPRLRYFNTLVNTPTYFRVFLLYLLCGSSSSRCTFIVYRDGGSASERGKLHNISLHVLYTSLVNFYVNYSLCTLRCFVHNYEGRRKQFFSGQANWLQNCVYREFQQGNEWSYL